MYTSRKNAIEKIAKLETFNGNSIYGRINPDGEWMSNGRIYGDAAVLWHIDSDARRIRYVVYSYATPIAWVRDNGEWVVPAEKYSATTSRHQSIVRMAVR
jgi:hypothetical protein